MNPNQKQQQSTTPYVHPLDRMIVPWEKLFGDEASKDAMPLFGHQHSAEFKRHYPAAETNIEIHYHQPEEDKDDWDMNYE